MNLNEDNTKRILRDSVEYKDQIISGDMNFLDKADKASTFSKLRDFIVMEVSSL